MSVFNVIGPKFDQSVDMDLFHDDDVLTPLDPEDKTMAHLLARLGKFKSVGEARRNGWDRPIPSGWHEFKIGKGANMLELYIWNPTHTLAEFEAEFSE